MGQCQAHALLHIEKVYDEAAQAATTPPPTPSAGQPQEDDVWRQYDRLVAASKVHDVGLTQLLSMKQPPDVFVDFGHIGVLYALDKDKRGRFSLADLKNFVFWCDARVPEGASTVALTEEVQTAATMEMWEAYAREGPCGIAEWLLEVARNSGLGCPQGGGCEDSASDTTTESACSDAGSDLSVGTLHTQSTAEQDALLRPKDCLDRSQVEVLCTLLASTDAGVDHQSLFALTAMSLPGGASAGARALAREVPAAALAPFLNQFITSYFTLLSNLGLESLLADHVRASR